MLFRFLSIIEAILVVIFAIKYINISMLMLSILIVELFTKDIKKIYLGILLSNIPLLFLSKDSDLKSVVIILVNMLAFILIYEIQAEKIKKLDEIQENQRKLIYNLQKKMAQEIDIQEQILYTARLEERNNISSRLHDKIGHTISGTLLQLEASKFILDKDKEKGFSMLESCIDNLRKGMDEIRMTLRNIKPAEEELGINRIRRILDEKIKGTKINGKVTYTGNIEKISASLWMIFMHSITELTTNSIKYSKGDLIEIKIEILNKFIKLEVKDNGLGCEKVKKGIGLRNIEESISNINGKVIINNEDGFDVIILIPY
ncbi:histidine kinase [Clostridium sp.]|uniref:sensor histidine kinase n=1 Tax=Clostridium sp. TaxID=1506 RepID=UPI0025BFF3F9|nr:histidine kinase [Clostridium sp.]